MNCQRYSRLQSFSQPLQRPFFLSCCLWGKCFLGARWGFGYRIAGPPCCQFGLFSSCYTSMITPRRPLPPRYRKTSSPLVLGRLCLTKRRPSSAADPFGIGWSHRFSSPPPSNGHGAGIPVSEDRKQAEPPRLGRTRSGVGGLVMVVVGGGCHNYDESPLLGLLAHCGRTWFSPPHLLHHFLLPPPPSLLHPPAPPPHPCSLAPSPH